MLPFALVLAQSPHGLNPAYMDRSVVVRSPADLYAFANGAWQRSAKVPESKMEIGVPTEIQDRNASLLRRAAERAAATRKPLDTPEGRVGLMVRLGKDVARADRLGASPLRAELARIDAVRDRPAVMRALARLTAICATLPGDPFSVPCFVGQAYMDPLDTSRMRFFIYQASQILPKREHYLGKDKEAQATRAAYRATFARMLKLAGAATPKTQAALALGLDTQLARASFSPVELRDLAKNYNPMDSEGLRKLAPHAPWGAYFAELGIAPPKRINVAQPRFIRAFDALVASRPLADWRAYLRCHLLRSYAPFLSDGFVKAHQGLTAALSGQTKSPPRWRIALDSADALLGEDLGRLYVREALPPAAKAKVRAIAQNVTAALDERLADLDWMTPPTREAARAKLRAITLKLGYPDRWRDDADLRLRDDSWAANVMRVREFHWRRWLAKLDRPIDRSEWGMTPATVNATYNPLWNEITFPAAILQPPIFDPLADDASNYAGIGVGFGHEITHGFDDQGSQFDATGLRREWWSPEDRARYTAAGRAIVAQYGAYRSPTGLPVNGELTLGENIADIGGVGLAYAAYRRSLHGKEAPVIDGLTGDQRFFVAYAQSWRSLVRHELERTRIATDNHAPPTVRLQGVVSNLPAFYRAFGLPVPEGLPKVW